MLTARHPTFRSPRGKTAVVMTMLAASLASCTNALEPPVNEQSVPFYFYQGEKIFLRVDPVLLTAVPQVEGDTATLRAVLARAGVPADSIRPLWVPGHWFVHLPSSTSARRAEDAARELRMDAGVRFASAVYRLRDGGDCPLYLTNRLVVQFRAGTSTAAIDRLNAALGIRNERLELSSGTRSYEYPVQMAPTPLEFAAYYHVQDIVEWAEPDRIDGCRRVGA